MGDRIDAEKFCFWEISTICALKALKALNIVQIWYYVNGLTMELKDDIFG